MSPDKSTPAVWRKTGRGPVSEVVRPASGSAFLPLYLRVHFVDGANTATLYLDLDSAAGEEYDVRLFSVADRGTGADVNLVWTAGELGEPPGWAFGVQDGLKLTCAVDAATTWGIEFGYQLLS